MQMQMPEKNQLNKGVGHGGREKELLHFMKRTGGTISLLKVYAFMTSFLNTTIKLKIYII